MISHLGRDIRKSELLVMNFMEQHKLILTITKAKELNNLFSILQHDNNSV